MTDHNFNVAKIWFEDLRNQLLKIINEIDGGARERKNNNRSEKWQKSTKP